MESLSHLSMGRSRRHWRASCSRTVTPARLTVTWFFIFFSFLLKISFLYFFMLLFKSEILLTSTLASFFSSLFAVARIALIAFAVTWKYLYIRAPGNIFFRVLGQFNLHDIPFLVSWLLISFLNTNHQLLFAVTSSPESEVTGQVPRYFTCIV